MLPHWQHQSVCSQGRVELYLIGVAWRHSKGGVKEVETYMILNRTTGRLFCLLFQHLSSICCTLKLDYVCPEQWFGQSYMYACLATCLNAHLPPHLSLGTPPALNYCSPWCAGTSLGNPWGCWEEKASCGAEVRFCRAGCRQGILFLSISMQGQRWQKRIKRLWLGPSHYVGTGICLSSS